jgi:hypothetical protein
MGSDTKMSTSHETIRHPDLWHRAATGLPWSGAARRAASGSCGDLRRPPADESQNTLDDSTGTFAGSTIQLYYDPRSDYSNSNQDQRPGVRLSTSIAQPANRLDLIGPISYSKSVSGTWFNTRQLSNTSIPTVRASTGTPPVWDRLGTMGRNQLHGPGDRTVDFSAHKNLHLTERFALELHGDAFNAFNTPQFNNPGGNFDDQTSFDKLTSVKLYTNRQIQLAPG